MCRALLDALPPRMGRGKGFDRVERTTSSFLAGAEVRGSGEVITLDDLRTVLAKRHETAVTCPVSTAIFANICARAAEEQRALSVGPKMRMPWWRVLKNGGLFNPKLPGGVERQRALLDHEGVRVAPLRKHLAVSSSLRCASGNTALNPAPTSA